MENRDAMVRGWMHGHAVPLSSVQVRGPKGGWHDVTRWSARPDLVAHYPAIPNGGDGCGFSVLVPDAGVGPLLFRARVGGEEVRFTADLPRRAPSSEDAAAMQRHHNAWAAFIREANDKALVVLEIGSRLVGPASASWRPSFHGAAHYVGFDVHPAPGVDVVGDAHTLTAHVGRDSVGALFSVAVLEHVALPWVLAREVNRALCLGGLTFHVTVQSWPVHEEPNDFWRYTDEALRLLFGPMNGFEVVGAGMCQRMHMYPQDRTAGDPGTGFFPGYANAWVLARKVAELPGEGGAGVPAEQLAELSRRYPRHGSED